VLSPTAPVFIGFKRVPTGMEFRDGDEFVQFTPEGVEVCEDGQTTRFSGEQVLLGWALDQDGRVCALYRQASGFFPPPEAKLLRFLSEQETSAESGNLTLLGRLSEPAVTNSAPPAPA
jgi:hypothetical protein